MATAKKEIRGRRLNRSHAGKRLRGAVRDDTAQRIQAVQREQRVIDLRKAGLTFEAIARAVGYTNKGAAQKAFTRAMETHREETAEAAADLRAIQLERYEHIISQLWPFCQVRPAIGVAGTTAYIPPQPPDPKYISRLLQAMAQKEELLGMQPPRGHQAPEDATEVARKIRLALEEMDTKFPKAK
jgi:hypothetical protein